MKTITRYIVIGWLLYAALIYVVMLNSTDAVTATVRCSAIILPQLLIFYLNYSWLAPNYLEANKTRTYFISIIIILALFTYFGGLTDHYLREHFPFSPDKKHIHPSHSILPYIARFFMSMMPVVISTLILKSVLLSQKNKESFELKNKMLEAETKALKAQINPHFLFNTLNNIYSLSQLSPTKTGDAILQLSDILRYVTYEGSQRLVPLQSEIAVIKQFIELQLLKDEDKSNIHVNIAVENTNLKISPLLLIPIIENCFKHGNHYDKAKGWVKITLRAEGEKLFLTASNSTAETGQQTKDKTGGVGMENVRKRLALLYPNQHQLVIRIDHYSYTSELEINLTT